MRLEYLSSYRFVSTVSAFESAAMSSAVDAMEYMAVACC